MLQTLFKLADLFLSYIVIVLSRTIIRGEGQEEQREQELTVQMTRKRDEEDADGNEEGEEEKNDDDGGGRQQRLTSSLDDGLLTWLPQQQRLQPPKMGEELQDRLVGEF